jgi:hypothetical protein
MGESVDLAAARFVGALEAEADLVAATFLLENARDEDYGGRQTQGYKTRIVTISRKGPGGVSSSPLFDLYGLDYRKTLVGSLEDKRPVSHLLSTFWILLSNAPKLLFSVRRRSKRSAEKWQVRLGWCAYLLLFAYFVTIIGAAAGTLAGPVEPQSATAPAATVDGGAEATPPAGGDAEAAASALATRVADLLRPVAAPMQVFVVWVTAIGLFLKVDLKAWIRKSGLGITAASEYLTLDRRRQTLEDQFAALLNHIGEKRDVEYRRVHVVSYSFGSIVALDALFPYERPAAVLSRVHTLVTVGCPFDFIRTYWPTYFHGRTQLPGVPGTWINIYAAADVLGSDFVDYPPTRRWRALGKGGDSPPAEATRSGISVAGVETPRHPDLNERYGRSTSLDQYSLMEKLGFLGFAMHRQYWEGTGPGCYRNVVRAMFKDELAVV